jgi:hypothetical protein
VAVGVAVGAAAAEGAGGLSAFERGAAGFSSEVRKPISRIGEFHGRKSTIPSPWTCIVPVKRLDKSV